MIIARLATSRLLVAGLVELDGRQTTIIAVGSAIIGLLGALGGGSLVLVGDVIARRSERCTAHLERLRLAPADVIASYLRARSHLIAARRFGREMSRDELFPQERHLALALLCSLLFRAATPCATRCFELGEVTRELIEAQSEDAVEAAFAKQLAAVCGLEGAVRDMVAAD